MDSNKISFNTLKNGSKEEIGKAITILSRLKDPTYKSALIEIMNSDDPFLSVMAAYALGESGDKSAFKFLEKIVHDSSKTFSPFKEIFNLDILEEMLKFPDKVIDALDLYNTSYFVESKEKLIDILEIFSIDPPKMGIPHFDDLVAFSCKKTKGLILDALAVSELHLGNIDSALQYSIEAITIAQEVCDPQLLKIAYADMGFIHMSLGNYYSALELIHESLEVDKTSHDPWRKRNRIISALSQLYYLVGRYERALEYIQEALEFSGKENDRNGKAKCLNTKGVILSDLNEFEQAEESLHEALAISINELNDRTLQGIIITNLSYVYYSLSELEKAKECLEDALELSIEMSDKSTEGTILSNMAILELESDNIEEAKIHAEAALDISMKTHNLSDEADAKYILGSIEDYWYDNPDMAYPYYRDSISISETLRKNLMLDDFKISFAGNYIGLYQQMTSLCLNIGNIDEAFKYIEQSKSRALVDMLYPAMNEISSKKISDEILEEINILKGKLDFIRKKLNSAYSSLSKVAPDANDGRQQKAASAILEEIDHTENLYKNTFEELKIKDPEWASLISVDVTDLKTVQDILDEKTLLLELYQTDNEVIILAIRKDNSPFVFRTPIDIETELERVYSLFADLSEGVNIDTRSHEYIKNVKQPLSYFYNMLILPVLKEMNDISHIIIAPHFFWHYLPFHALYDSELKEYLIDKFSISYTPSVTVLYLCHKKDHKQYESALILANPANDLPYADDEAEKVKDRFNNNAHLFKGKTASFDKLSAHRESDVIHIACHGYFRGDEPLFSHLVFSGDNPDESCFFLPDIFNQRLKTSLVTLSACETGLSHYTSGDELIGISRAFFYAGAPSLLASLWTVNDKSTASLMDSFYEGILEREETRSMALKSAILELKAMPEFSHPYFWAPFFLSGDWR